MAEAEGAILINTPAIGAAMGEQVIHTIQYRPRHRGAIEVPQTCYPAHGGELREYWLREIDRLAVNR